MPLLIRGTRSGAAIAIALAGALLAGACATAGPVNDPEERSWIQLFNGEDLAGWKVKFAEHDVGVNLHDTFRVEEGILRVTYEDWPSWTGEMGHLIHDSVFSHYLVAAEYRFVGEQVAGANIGWARRNNGLMLHSQGAEAMRMDQGYPNSMEMQLLGGLGEGPRTTANLCTPGTVFERDGELDTTHCVNSASATYDGDRWVRVEALVLGDSLVQHIVEGDTVFTYSRPQLGEVRRGETPQLSPLTSGHIAIQAESAPTDFRKIEVLNLEGCMDPAASNFRSYFVKSNPARCTY
jgi:hypothetical protein